MNDFALKETMVRLTQSNVNICLGLLGVFFMVALMHSIIKNLIQGEPTKIVPIISLFISCFLLIIYVPIVNGITIFTNGMAELFPAPDLAEAWQTSWSDWMGAAWSFVKGDNMNFTQKLVAANGTYLIKLLMNYIQDFTLYFMFVVGPISFLFDLFPLFRGTANRWFIYTFSIAMWDVTFAILDQFLYGYLTLYNDVNPHMWMGLTPFADGGMIYHTITCLMFMIMYIFVAFLTTLYVTRSDAAALGAKVFSVAALGTAIAVRGATMGMSAVASKGVSQATPSGNTPAASPPPPPPKSKPHPYYNHRPDNRNPEGF